MKGVHPVAAVMPMVSTLMDTITVIPVGSMYMEMAQ